MTESAKGADKVRPMPITHALDTLNFLHPGGGVFEVCIIGPKVPRCNLWEGNAGGKKPIVAGWFRDPASAAKLAVRAAAEGVYTTLNSCKEALLARADHRLKAGVNRTKDGETEKIGNLLIDLDPLRPEGISSTDQEYGAALEMAQVIKADLTKEGWPEPLVGDSGNGAHLVYPLDLPNTPESVDILKAVLKALSLRYQEHLARRNLEIDQAVFNPARLTKLYGTMVQKGDNTQDRPHRLSQIISLPQGRHPVPLDLLQKLSANGRPQGTPTRAKEAGTMEGRLDVEAYLNHYGVEVALIKPHQGGTLFCLQECVFDSSHTGNEAAIGQAADGKLFFQCFHKSCKGRIWAEARVIISGHDKLGKFVVGGPAQPGPALPGPDYDQEERAAIQAEARAPVHKNSLVLGTSMSTNVDKALRAAGWAEDRIYQVVHILAQSAKSKGILNLAAEVREWVLSTSGDFMSTDVDRELQLSTLSTSPQEKKVILVTMSKALERLVKEGVLARVGTRRGHFRRIEKESEIIDFANADTSIIFDLRWPASFHLERLVNLYPKNIVIVAGATNAGKTALLLNIVRENMTRHRIVYFSSEMGAEELRLRLGKFQDPISSWKFEARERAGNFADATIPDAVNIIDYFELTDNFYQVGGEIKKIFDRLTTGIAIIAIQKDENKEFARGGAFSAEKARLYLSMNPGELKVVKGKNWAQQGYNPNGKIINFKLVDGCKFLSN